MTIKVGSRKSRLALKQVEIVMNCLEIDDYEVIKFSTEGDKKSAMGHSQFDKLNFVEDIESKLLLKEIDIAVHSAKDMPANLNMSFDNFFITEEDDSDAPGETFGDDWNKDILIFRNDIEPIFKKDMKLGTSSLRRQMQAKFFLGAQNIFNLNGNINTRIEKLESGEFDCIILANAGCKRLGFELNSILLDKHITPTPQGLICIQKNKDFILPHSEIIENILIYREDGLDLYLNNINMGNKFLKEIGADCHSALAVEAWGEDHSGHNPVIHAEIYGKNEYISISDNGSGSEDEAIQQTLEEFYKKGGKDLLNEHN